MSEFQEVNRAQGGQGTAHAFRDRVKELRRVKASELRPNPKNWRTHPDSQRAALSGVLTEIGYAGALLAREADGGQLVLIDGHLRAETTPDQEVPVLVLDVTEAEADKLLAVVDPIGAMATVDAAKLESLLAEITTDDAALRAMLDGLAGDAGLNLPVEIVEDEAPAPPVEPITRPGDLWILGGHRLLCGDSTKAEDVGRLFDGAKAGLLFTSPPYAQQRDYGKAKDLVQDWDGLMQGVFGAAGGIMEPDGQILVNLGLVHRDGEWVPYWDGWIVWMREQGWRRFGWYVWDQGWGLPGDWNGRLGPSHEFVFHFNRESVRPIKFEESRVGGQKTTGKRGLRGKDGVVSKFSQATGPNGDYTYPENKIPDSVIRINRQCGSAGHPAPFSVDFAAFGMRCWPGLVYEPFNGSGTTIIAAEQLSRRCYAMELEPAYCDVAVTRWEKLTGGKAVRQ